MPGMQPDFLNRRTTEPVMSTLHKEAHTALDELMDSVQNGAATGGEQVLVTVDDDTPYRFRLTFCDFTNQRRCGSCQGTGLARSRSPHDN